MSENVVLVDARKLATMLSISKREVERMVADGRLPKPIRLGKRMIRWRVDTIRKWAVDMEAAASN